MASNSPISLDGDTTGQSAPTKPMRSQRVLACVLCQQRKVKCDRKFPCINCTKSRARCVPATQVPRAPRRRYVERELLLRLREYEELLRNNGIDFKPFATERDSPDTNTAGERSGPPDDDEPPVTTWEASGTKNFWQAINQAFQEAQHNHDELHSGVQVGMIQDAWDQSFETADHLLFGTQKISIDLSTLQPDAVHIFRLWQLYLDNVNPLFKVTHTPTLQAEIVEAASNTTSINPNLEALMFSIYFIAILSIQEVDCMGIFGLRKSDLLMRYQFGCEQALLKCEFMRTDNRDCLTALFLYLVAARLTTDPRTLSAMLGTAVRIIQQNEYHNEVDNLAQNPLEAEMRRRLWWALVLFDARIGQMAGNKVTNLLPIWDCKLPRNLNDSDLRSELKEYPATQDRPGDAVFAAIRSEMGDFLRFCNFHLEFTNPLLKQLRRKRPTDPGSKDSEVVELRQSMETKYLQYCQKENPVHLMTSLCAEAYLATASLLEFFCNRGAPSSKTAAAQSELGMHHAFVMLEADTKLMSSPLIQGFHWYLEFHFPFLGYLQIAQELRQRPTGPLTDRAWDVMSRNYAARLAVVPQKEYNPFFAMFSKMILGAWAVREEAVLPGEVLQTPPVVLKVEEIMMLKQQGMENAYTGLQTPFQAMFAGGGGPVDTFAPDMGNYELHDLAMFPGQTHMSLGEELQSGMPIPTFGTELNQVDWLTGGWGLGSHQG